MIVRSLHKSATRRGFTLVELLITISIIGIMASMVLFAMFSAQEAAREQKTRALITKLNNIVIQRYESYRTRRVPFVFPTIPQNASPANKVLYQKEISRARLDCIRDLMRMEMPDRWSDIIDIPAAPFPVKPTDPANGIVDYGGRKLTRPSINGAYYARATAPGATPSAEHEGAECLYMIVMQALAQESDSRDVFKAGDIGDLDDDDFPEFLDAWRSPIHFLRWAPGFLSTIQNPIRGTIENVTGGGQSVIVRAIGQRYSSGNNYIGGTIAVLFKDPAGQMHINTDKLARITGFTYDAGTGYAEFTCETPTSKTMQPSFQSMPAADDEFVVMAGDPSDSRGTYPIYNPGGSTKPDPDTSVPTFALYPLIFSEGRDKVAGINTGGSALRYSLNGTGDPALNPFFIPAPASYSFGLMVGGVPAAAGATEQGFYQGCEVDNITSHDLNRR